MESRRKHTRRDGTEKCWGQAEKAGTSLFDAATCEEPTGVVDSIKEYPPVSQRN